MKTIDAASWTNNNPPLQSNRSSSRSSSILPGASTASGCWRRKSSRAPRQPVPLDQEITFDIVDADRKFPKSLDKLREIQGGRAGRVRRDLKDATALLELHKHRGIPWGLPITAFFSKEHVLFYMQPARRREASSSNRPGWTLARAGPARGRAKLPLPSTAAPYRTFLLRHPLRLRHSRTERPCRAQPKRKPLQPRNSRSTGQFIWAQAILDGGRLPLSHRTAGPQGL